MTKTKAKRAHRCTSLPDLERDLSHAASSMLAAETAGTPQERERARALCCRLALAIQRAREKARRA